MKLDEAKATLSAAQRDELRDHAFGDCEVYWVKDDQTIASGYFGADGAEVTIEKAIMVADGDGGSELGPIRFTGDDARALRNCGSNGTVERNDSTGPAQYREGETMPALTREGVLAEVTMAPCRRCSECIGEDHHFSESGLTCPADASDPYYECKHCSARAKVCHDCGAPIWPAWSMPLCRACNTERIDDDDARAREEW